MSRTTTLNIPFSELPESAKLWLQSNGFQIDEDPYHLWCSKNDILEQIYDSGEGPDLDEIPEEIWRQLAPTPKLRTELEAHWAKNPDNEVEWE